MVEVHCRRGGCFHAMRVGNLICLLRRGRLGMLGLHTGGTGLRDK